MTKEDKQIEEDLKKCEEEIQTIVKGLKDKHDAAWGANKDQLKAVGKDGDPESSNPGLKMRRKFTADAKISDMCWWPSDNDHICTILQDGKIIIWNAKTGQKAYFLCQNTWLMCGDFSKNGKRLAVAGLDNLVTIHEVPDLTKAGEGGSFDPAPDTATYKVKQMEKHGGYIGSVKWLDDQYVISGSGDESILLWDANLDKGVQKDPEATFIGHGLSSSGSGDVAALDTYTGDNQTFISGASDKLCKLWDRRALNEKTNGCVMTFTGHTNNVNKVKYLPNGQSFMSASDDGTCILFDKRFAGCVQKFRVGDKCKCTSVGLSKSGRYMCSGYNNGAIKVWDMLHPTEPVATLENHTGEVTAIELSNDGKAFASGAREIAPDNFLIWA